MNRAKIIATGYYLPSRILTNEDLEKIVDTTDEWITTRTGIKERHIAENDESSSDMGIKAGSMALEKAGLEPEDIDAVICATITPDHFFPSTACLIQKGLNLKNSFAFDVSAACSGFIYALHIAEAILLQDRVKTVLVIAAEKMSSITDWKDRATCVLFGDGAGAAILQKKKGDRGILSSFLGSDGNFGDLLIVPAGGSRTPVTEEIVRGGQHFLHMKGNEVFKVAVQKMVNSALNSLGRAGLEAKDVKLLIPHQANLRIIKAVAKRLKLRDEQVFINVDKVGNMSAATIALGLAEAEEKKIIKSGDIVNLVSFGAGFTWAGMVLRW
ncbi:MAG: ketoacyl-ACP synthase III [Elusimicrobia bacterium]|nr:ketoacyl-ACP synthase III [Elusimicrobiota bacterium]